MTTKRKLPLPNPTPSQERFNRAVAAGSKGIQKAILDYATGKGGAGAREFGKRLTEILAERHGAAAALGRQRAGSKGKRTRLDDYVGVTVMQREQAHLGKFVQEILLGRYTDEDGNAKVSQLKRRAESYLGRMVGTANETFVMASGKEALFTWVLGGAEKHCSACPSLAAGSPYTSRTLPTMPKKNQTPCLMNCLCHLLRDDGMKGFE